eukprot:403345598
MGHSFKQLRINFNIYWAKFYNYLLQAIYWGSVPSIIMFGLFSKPYSPLIIAMWQTITGQEDTSSNDMYGAPPQGFY